MTALNNYYFFFNDTATTEIYTLSLHDALPILVGRLLDAGGLYGDAGPTHRREDGVDRHDADGRRGAAPLRRDRKSTRLNSSHANISYAVFCLKKKNHTYAIYVTLLNCSSQ